MRTIMRLSLCLFFLLLFVRTASGAGPELAYSKVADGAGNGCLRMVVDASDIPGFGGQPRQHYRILFENLCNTVRIVYWCAELPAQAQSASPVCIRSAAQAGIAAPLYAVARRREFQWTYPQGTRIRYVDCDDSRYPTGDFRCATLGPQNR